MQPYVGITGFMRRREVEIILDSVSDNTNRLIMIGILVSRKTLVGEPNKWPHRYPRVELISDIFVKHPKALNLIHLSTKEHLLLEHMIRITDLAGENFHGFQLNMAWPSVEIISQYRSLHSDKNKKIVLQVGSYALEVVHCHPGIVANRVAEYGGLIDYVLLDQSCGYGKILNLDKTRNFLYVLKENVPNIGLVVAGGLNPSRLSILKSLAKEFPDLSIDAESGLRDDRDYMDLVISVEYLEKSLQIFKTVSKS